jgi:cytochrome c
MQLRAWMCAAAVIVILAAVSAPSVAQQLTGSPQRGRELALKLCTGCHAVSRDSPVRRSDVPSFPAIAERPGVSAEQLAGRIIIPHPAMPGVPLTINEIRDLVAFITSLKAN